MNVFGSLRTLVLLLLLSGAAAAADGPGLQQMLSLPSGTVRAGRIVEVQVWWLNDGPGPASVTVPPRLPIRLSTAERGKDALLRIADAEKAGAATIGPGRFHRVAYRLALSDDLVGQITVRVEGAAAGVITVHRQPAEAKEEEAPSPADTEETLSKAYFADNFYGYEPMYFLYGPDPQDARFQFSLKYRILNTSGPLAKKWSPLRGVFFGYTQTSLWDLNADSWPFEDTSYKPEFFYLRQNAPLRPGAGVQRVDFQTGIQHESNGRGGKDSRSLNIAYVRPTLIFGNPEGYRFTVSPKVYTYIGDLSDNPDIYRYRGYFDLHLDYGSPDGWKVASILRKGTEGSNGSIQLDVTYPLNRLCFQNVDFFVQGQLFSGYGETLLHYDQSDTRFRIGLAVYR